jgi:hypothetical protein
MAAKRMFSERLAKVGFAVLAGLGCSLEAASPGTARADALETLKPGVLQVAIEPPR